MKWAPNETWAYLCDFFLSLRVFGLLSSSLLLFSQRFRLYVLRPSSGVCRTFMEFRTTSFIESTRVVCSDSVSHNRVQVLSIPVLLLACSQDWTCNVQMIVSFEGRSSKFHGGSRVWQTPEEGRRTYRPKRCNITLKMKTTVRKPLMIKIIKLRRRNLDN